MASIGETFPVIITEFISNVKFTTGSRINAITAHAQTLLSCLNQAALDRLRVHYLVTHWTRRSVRLSVCLSHLYC